ncbi:MAG: hypothetical protein Q9162_007799 [Coniocarpon cinnabarinum]
MLSPDTLDSTSLPVDLPTISGITGSISIACWVVVFSPQIIENFRRSSAEGLSIVFIVIWLAGDVFNILGAVLQGVLPTMIILAVYYTLADVVLMVQCFYYRGLTLSDTPTKPSTASAGEQDPLLGDSSHRQSYGGYEQPATDSNEISPAISRRSSSTIRAQLSATFQQDGTHLSPAVPVHSRRDDEALKAQSPVQKQSSILKSVVVNVASIIVVCAAGVLGWWLSVSASKSASAAHHHGHRQANQRVHEAEASLDFNLWGQIFGYVCAVLYLGSRVPQLLLNYRRKSTEGISMLFFIFACLGNLLYVISIFAYEPPCLSHRYGCQDGELRAQYARYIAVNLSWIIGSAGTLGLDLVVFVQYFMYRNYCVSDGIEGAVH